MSASHRARVWLIAAIVALTAVAFSRTAQARVFRHPSGFRFWVPDGWKTTTSADGATITASSNDGRAMISFAVAPRGADRHLLMREWGKQMRRLCSNARSAKPARRMVNDLDLEIIDGSGTMKGVPMDYSYGVYWRGPSNLIVVAVCANAQMATYGETLVKTAESVRL